MLIIGLTGSIGMGKSTAAAMLRRYGVPVNDADAAVHRLLGRGGAAVAAVEDAFPGVVADGEVVRAELGRRVFGDRAALKRLEAILHPLVGLERDRFLRRNAVAGQPLVALDVPLLFETGGDRRCDAVVLVSAPTFLQAQRVLRRPGMSPERLASIRRQQMADPEKRLRADFVVPTGLGRGYSLRVLARIVRLLKKRQPRRWPPRPLPRYRNARGRPRYRNDGS